MNTPTKPIQLSNEFSVYPEDFLTHFTDDDSFVVFDVAYKSVSIDEYGHVLEIGKLSSDNPVFEINRVDVEAVRELAIKLGLVESKACAEDTFHWEEKK